MGDQLEMSWSSGEFQLNTKSSSILNKLISMSWGRLGRKMKDLRKVCVLDHDENGDSNDHYNYCGFDDSHDDSGNIMSVLMVMVDMKDHWL